MTKKMKVITGSFSVGFIMAFAAWMTGFGLIGTAVIAVLTIIGKTLGFKFDRLKLFLGVLLGAALAVIFQLITGHALGRILKDEAHMPDVGPVVNMTKDASGAYVRL